ncbi:MAG: GntR family transcriptional regulator [Deltaproteobacteria bacterium]|nr:GntR family transcriptional regulator [Deltaproteobacteria bacterium]
MAAIPIDHSNLGEKVYRAVRTLILNQTYSPGSKINVQQLSRDLKVSRTPVWESLRRLEAEGFVETVPRYGVYVVNFTLDRVEELYAVREVLDGLAARLAAQHIEPERLADLEACLKRQEAMLAARDFDGYKQSDLDFHSLILEAAGNATLAKQAEQVYGQIFVLRLRTLILPESFPVSTEYHWKIYHAIASRDGALAERMSRRHVQIVKQDALKVLTKEMRGGKPWPAILDTERRDTGSA